VFDDDYSFESDITKSNFQPSFHSNSESNPLWQLNNYQDTVFGTDVSFDVESYQEGGTTLTEEFDNSEISGLSSTAREETDTRDYLTGVDNNEPLAGARDLENTSFNQTTESLSLINSNETELVEGTLGADTFVFDLDFDIGFFSGNGNVEYGQGERDLLDLSRFSSESVDFNLAGVNRGGVLVTIGDNQRLFDEITLSNGDRILFEGIETIRFSDSVRNLVDEPNDPLFEDQWNLHITGVHTAWRFTRGSNDVLIGIEDSGLGVDSNENIHPDLRANDTFILPDNYSDEFFENGESQDISHGTAVQGIIAADGDNSIGISGINWNSDVFHLDYDDFSNNTSIADIAQRIINEARSEGQRLVINLSLGTSTFNALSPIHFDLRALASANPNVLFVIASGNDGASGVEGLTSPAILARDFDNVIAVGAAEGNRDIYGDVSSLETPGKRRDFSQYGNGLTLLAPSQVVTTGATPFLTDEAKFTYHDYSISGEFVFDGTSASTPHVTGIVSLLLSVNPDLTGSQVKNILSETSYDVGSTGYDIFTGAGLVNADKAVRTALAMART
jgi:subtilisin family serine protease